MKKTLILVMLSLLAVGMLLAKETIRVGVILPLSSMATASVGESARDALLLRVSQIPADSKFDYKLFIEDDGYLPRQTIMATQRLISLSKVDFLMTLWEPGTRAAIPVLQRTNKVIHISPSRWTSPPSYPYDFVLSASAESYAGKFTELLNALNIKTVAIFVSQDGANKYMLSFLLPMLKEKGIEVVDTYECNGEVRDFRPWIAKLKEKKPQAVIHNAFLPAAELILRQMHELDFRPLQIGTNFFAEVRPEFVEGECYLLQYPDRKDFAEAYAAKYHHAPRYPAANYYDALSIIVDTLEKFPVDKKPTPEEIAKVIRQIKEYDGAMGPTTFVPPNKLECRIAYYIIQNGKSRVISLEELVKLKGIK